MRQKQEQQAATATAAAAAAAAAEAAAGTLAAVNGQFNLDRGVYHQSQRQPQTQPACADVDANAESEQRVGYGRGRGRSRRQKRLNRFCTLDYIGVEPIHDDRVELYGKSNVYILDAKDERKNSEMGSLRTYYWIVDPIRKQLYNQAASGTRNGHEWTSIIERYFEDRSHLLSNQEIPHLHISNQIEKYYRARVRGVEYRAAEAETKYRTRASIVRVAFDSVHNRGQYFMGRIQYFCKHNFVGTITNLAKIEWFGPTDVSKVSTDPATKLPIVYLQPVEKDHEAFVSLDALAGLVLLGNVDQNLPLAANKKNKTREKKQRLVMNVTASRCEYSNRSKAKKSSR